MRLGYLVAMSALAKMREEALSLSEDERLELAADLVASVHEAPGPNWEAALVVECNRRMEALESGKTQDVSWEEVEAELESEMGIR